MMDRNDDNAQCAKTAKDIELLGKWVEFRPATISNEHSSTQKVASLSLRSGAQKNCDP